MFNVLLGVMVLASLNGATGQGGVSTSPPTTIMFIKDIKEVMSFGDYTIALADGIPGVVWWKEAGSSQWHPDLMLTLMGYDIKNLLADEQPGVIWYYADVPLTLVKQSRGEPFSVWVRKDLGNGKAGHYGSRTTYFENGPPDGARIIYEKPARTDD